MPRGVVQAWREAVVGTGKPVPLVDGSWVPYVNLDNAATTPPLVEVRDRVDAFLEWYSSVHRGTGFKSRLSTEVYEQARRVVLEFVGADDGDRIAIFTKHTTEALNKLAHRYPFQPEDVVVLTELEHHANLLPWRGRAAIEYLPTDTTGAINLNRLEEILREQNGKVRLVSISGASNVTGYRPPIHDAAEIAHRYGAEIAVDAAQLAPHCRIEMRPLDDPRRIDYLAFSGHKMYAPYGIGVLIGPRARFADGEPDLRGGGAVRAVTLDAVDWDDPPEREEAGTPNVVGAVALATAVRALTRIGMDALAAREEELGAYLFRRLGEVPALRLLGDAERMGKERIGVATFTLDGVDAQLAAAVLGFEWGIGVRAGRFCAHPYFARLLDEPEVVARMALRGGACSHLPGALRVSLGLYNTEDEVDRLVQALQTVTTEEPGSRYVRDEQTGEYRPVTTPPSAASVFAL